MGKLTERVIAELNQAKDTEDLRDCAWMASDLIRKASWSDYSSGFEEIDNEVVTDAERQQLQSALIDALQRNGNPRYVSQILSALSASRDRTVLPVWVEYLAKNVEMLKAANGAVYSALMGLDGIGEQAFVGNSNQSLLDIKRNIEAATKYLHERGIDIPW